MLKKLLITVALAILAIIIILKLNASRMENSPLKFVYIKKATLDTLLNEPNITQKAINNFVLDKGEYFNISEEIYRSFFLSNLKVKTSVEQSLLNYAAPNDSDSGLNIIGGLDRNLSYFLLTELNKDKELLKLEGGEKFYSFINELNAFEVYALISYSKKNGWFDYDSLKKEHDIYKKYNEDLIK